MKKSTIFAVLALLLSSAVSAQMMAMLVGQRFGTSVTGQTVLICVYQVSNQRFERAQALGSYCEPSIMVN